jgi:hypothetical protein
MKKGHEMSSPITKMVASILDTLYINPRFNYNVPLMIAFLTLCSLRLFTHNALNDGH